MRVGVIGAGHVGLPTAAALAQIGHEVVVHDIDAEKVERLERGDVPFFELGMLDLIRSGVESQRLRFSTEMQEVVEDARVVFICVGTPPLASGAANLLAVEEAAEAIATHTNGPLVVVHKSTVPAGTAERVGEVLRRTNSAGDFQVVSNPEFLREGNAVEDSLRPNRILVGSDSPEALEVMADLYRPIIEGGTRWIETNVRTAELAKHACNAFLALKISYANALARVSELVGADVVSVTDVMGSDPRIGPAFLGAGLGYGGYCFPKDLAAFETLCRKIGYEFPLLREIARINDEAVNSVFALMEKTLWNLSSKRIALLGLAFKPGTDDVRFSPAIRLAQMLIEAGATVVGFDPQASANAKAELPELAIAPDPYDALTGAHCAVIATEWDEFRTLDRERMQAIMARPVVVDARNLFEPEDMDGFTYLAVGRGSPSSRT